MDGDLGRVVAEQGGFCHRWQALDCGVSENEIAHLLRAKEWVAVRRGAYAPRELVESLDAAGRHVLTVRAAVSNLDGLVVVSHYSALAVMGVPMWGVDLNEVHVHREVGRSSRREAGVVHHVGALPGSQVIEIGGLLVAAPERAVMDAARDVPFEAGVVLADGARHRLAFDLDRAAAILEDQRDWAGSIRAARVLHFSDPRAETVGESRTRVLMARLGLPAPDLQCPIYDRDGRLIGVSDLYIDKYRTAIEFDGHQKYARAFYEQSQSSEPVDLGEIVWREKLREDSIRDEGSEMVRLVWFELDGHDRAVRGRFHRAFDRFTSRRRTA